MNILSGRSPTSSCCIESVVKLSKLFTRWPPGTPQFFWRQYKERQSSKCNIPTGQWKATVEALYKAPKAPAAAPADDITSTLVNPPQSPLPDLKAQSRSDASEPDIDFLNAVITHEDGTAALKRLTRSKAASVDDIRAEFILNASDIFLDLLVQTFNQVLLVLDQGF